MEAIKYLPLSDVVGALNAVMTTAFKQTCIPGYPWSSGWHNGVDIECAAGTPIYAAADGTVVNTDTVAHTDGFGNRCIIRHADGRATLYAHMIAKALVAVGQEVKRGQLIGKVGSTGLSTGPHLHITLLDRYDENPNIYYTGYLLDPAIVLGVGTLKWSKYAKPTTEVAGMTGKPGKPAEIVTSNFKIGDTVEFHGNRHYAASNSTAAYPCTAGRAKITNIASNSIHPYHLQNDGTGSSVYGWVNEDDITPKSDKSLEVIAQEVIAGKWGNGNERKVRLEKAGYDYHAVQKAVNNLL